MTPGPFRAILLDIEGTTTPVSFVYDTLFPYARTHFGDYLAAHWSEPDVQNDVALFRSQSQAELAAGVHGAVAIPGLGSPEDEIRAAVLASAIWQMDNDRKTTGLKSIQGRIWVAGYDSGELKADLFEEVHEAILRWHSADKPIFIYSSGSIAAQKLLFAHTHHGDLTPLLAGYFDTRTGPKKEAASYTAIAASMRFEAGDILFATDVVAEARAAHEAGLQTVIMDRPGNKPQPAHGFAVLQDFCSM